MNGISMPSLRTSSDILIINSLLDVVLTLESELCAHAEQGDNNQYDLLKNLVL